MPQDQPAGEQETSPILRLEENLVDNRQLALIDILQCALSSREYEEIDITVGFLFLSGLTAIKDGLEQFFSSGGRMRIVMGNLTTAKTYEQLAMAHQSLEQLAERHNRSLFSSADEGEIERQSRIIGEHIGYSDHSPKNEELYHSLIRWLDEGQLKIRIYTKEFMHAKCYLLKPRSKNVSRVGLVGSSNLTLPGLSGNTELNAGVFGAHYHHLSTWFENLWEASEDFNPALLKVLRESWTTQLPGTFPPPYIVLMRGLYELFGDTIEAGGMGGLILRQMGDVLYDFQMDAVKRAISVINRYGGVLISDVVGLGKSYIGLALLEHYSTKDMFEGMPHSTTVIAPASLVRSWEELLRSFSIDGKVFSSGLLTHLEDHPEIREQVERSGIILVDEAHNYTNPEAIRYRELRTLLTGKKAVLLTATPYRKRYGDIINQLRLFMHGGNHPFLVRPPTWEGLRKKLEEGDLDPSYLLKEIMIRRTRHDLLQLYGNDNDEIEIRVEGLKPEILRFPERKLKTVNYSLSDTYSPDARSGDTETVELEGADVYSKLVDGIGKMRFARFNLFAYVRRDLMKKQPYSGLSASGPALKGLTRIGMLKRLESSWYALWMTLKRNCVVTTNFLKLLENGFVPAGDEFADLLLGGSRDDPVIYDDDMAERIAGELIAKNQTYKAGAFRTTELKNDLDHDLRIIKSMLNLLEPLRNEIEKDPLKDKKLATLLKLIEEERKEGRKVLVFSEFAETVEWISRSLREMGYGSRWRMAEVTGRTKGLLNRIRRFAPEANNADIAPEDELNVLISTDILSEGLNLQDANVVINYDLHWTPIKLIQRIGRLDRISTRHDVIWVYNFFPETTLDARLGLLEKIRNRVGEFNRALGEDGKLLEECEEWNPSAIESIYGGVADIIEDYEVDIGISVTTRPEKLLLQFREEHPAEFEFMKTQLSMRSIAPYPGDVPIGFFVCSDGTIPQFYTCTIRDGRCEIILKPLEELIDEAGLEFETPALNEFDMEIYHQASSTVMKDFLESLQSQKGSVMSDGRQTRSKKIIRILNKLQTYSLKDRRSEVLELIGLLRWGYLNDPPFAATVRKEIKGNISAETLIGVVKELLERHAIPAKRKVATEKQRMMGEGALRPHIVSGLILMPER